MSEWIFPSVVYDYGAARVGDGHRPIECSREDIRLALDRLKHKPMPTRQEGEHE